MKRIFQFLLIAFLPILTNAQELVGTFSTATSVEDLKVVFGDDFKLTGLYTIDNSPGCEVENSYLLMDGTVGFFFATMIDLYTSDFDTWKATATEGAQGKIVGKIEEGKFSAGWMKGGEIYFDQTVTPIISYQMLNGEAIIMIANAEKLQDSENPAETCDGFYLAFNSTEQLKKFIDLLQPSNRPKK